MAEKKKPAKITTPKGIFRYPALTKPDYGTQDYPKPNGVLKVDLILDEEKDAEFISKMQAIHDKAVEDGKKKFAELKVEQRKKLKELKVADLFTTEYDKATEEPTGRVIFKFATTASGENDKGEKWTRKIPLFDAKGKPVNLQAVGGGTVGKVSFEASPYFIPGTGLAGVKFYLVAAQIIELKVWSGSADAGEYGFGEEEGGFEAGDEPGSEFADESGEDAGGSEPAEENKDF